MFRDTSVRLVRNGVWHSLFLLCTLALVSTQMMGCAMVTAGDKVLNSQNIMAAQKIKTHVELTSLDKPLDRVFLKQAVMDMWANSLQLQEGLIGEPANPQPYSHEASEQARKDSKQQHDVISRLYNGAMGLVKDYVPGGAGIIGILTAIGMVVRKRLADKKTFTVIKGVEDLKEKALPDILDKFKHLALKDPASLGEAVDSVKGGINEVLKVRATAENLYPELKKDVKAVQNGGKSS